MEGVYLYIPLDADCRLDTKRKITQVKTEDFKTFPFNLANARHY